MSERRVLIIEPDDEWASAVERFLRTNGFHVARARDVEEGTWLAPLVAPHVALLDPGKGDGAEIARKFRDGNKKNKIPLVMMVPEDAENDCDDPAEKYRNAYDGFLYKPFADTELLRVVENFTGFGDAGETEAEDALDNFLREHGAPPELKSVVDGLQNRKSKKKPKQGDEPPKKTEAQERKLEAAEDLIKTQSQRISDLLDQMSDLELDHSFKIENLEAENKLLKEETAVLRNRVKELEDICKEAFDLIEFAQKTLQRKMGR